MLKAKPAVFSAGMLVLLAAAPVFAHHSYASTYLEDQDATVEGILVEFNYRSPHSFIQVEVTDPKTGAVVKWGGEWASTERLNRAGVTKDTLKAGDRLILFGHPNRSADEHRLHLVGVTRPSDGWKWTRN